MTLFIYLSPTTGKHRDGQLTYSCCIPVSCSNGVRSSTNGSMKLTARIASAPAASVPAAHIQHPAAASLHLLNPLMSSSWKMVRPWSRWSMHIKTRGCVMEQDFKNRVLLYLCLDAH